MLLGSMITKAQTKPNVTRTADGNYILISKKADSAKNTGNYVVIKDIKYPVYESAKGKLFIKRISKNNKEYNQYLKL